MSLMKIVTDLVTRQYMSTFCS